MQFLNFLPQSLIRLNLKVRFGHSSTWTGEDKEKISAWIDSRNKKFEVVRQEVFEGDGKSYRYFDKNGNLYAEGFYFALGYDKKGEIQDEKFQGKNIEYYPSGKIKEITFYKDGVLTGEYYYDEDGNLTFSQIAN